MTTISLRTLTLGALLGIASVAQAQSANALSPIPGAGQQTTTTTTTVIEVGGQESPRPVSTKPCPIPTGSRIRPPRDAEGRCPPESREDVEMDTQLSGQIGTSAGILRTQGN